LGVGHIQVAVDGRDAEGGEALRDVRVLEPAGHVDGLEVRVEDVDRAGGEVGGVEEGAAGCEAQGQPLVDRAGSRVVHGDDRVGRIDAVAPPGDRPVRGGEQLGGGAGRVAG